MKKIVVTPIAIVEPIVKPARSRTSKKAEQAATTGVEHKTRSRTSKVAVVVPTKKVYPIQIRHLRGVQPKGRKALVGNDTLTICGRVVVKQMTRVKPPTGATVSLCPQCEVNTHENQAFEIVR